MADAFDPIESGLPVTYEIIARNIGDTAGDTIVTFTPDDGFTVLDLSALNFSSCSGALWSALSKGRLQGNR
jgi:hypothetical protein